MNEDRLRDALRDAPIPDEKAAEERAWRIARIAFEERRAAPEPRRTRPARLAIAVVGAILLAAALALTPAGAKVGDLISDVFEPGRDRAETALTELPAGGRLLVESGRGPWIVNRDGAKRLLGEYDEATWSPGGLFVAATAGRELTALVGDPAAVGEPAGTVRWSLAAAQRVYDPAWSPSGFRVAYLSGESLRVVAGDGTEDRELDGRVAGVQPAWKPGSRHLLAYVDERDRRVRLADADSGRGLWASGRFTTRVTDLDWSADGKRLIVLTPTFFSVLDARGRTIAKGSVHGSATAAEFAPGGDRIALIRRIASARGGRSELVLLDGEFEERRLFAGRGRFTDVTWSPDGEWLLLSWKEADQWRFIRPEDERVTPISTISSQFDPGATGDVRFPRVSGWCCAP